MHTYLSTTQDVEADKDGRPKLPPPFMELLRGGRNGKAFPLRPKLTGHLIPQNINIWIGNSPHGASSGLHHDYHDNPYTVSRGTKRFRLYDTVPPIPKRCTRGASSRRGARQRSHSSSNIVKAKEQHLRGTWRSIIGSTHLRLPTNSKIRTRPIFGPNDYADRFH